MRHISKKLSFGGTAIAGLCLATGCDTISLDKLSQRQLGQVCTTYCNQAAAPVEPGFAVMMKKAWVNGERVDVPMRNIMIRSEDEFGNSTLVTPYNAQYGYTPALEGGAPLPDKTAGLDPSCFATETYEPIDLSDVDLTPENITITFVNIDRNGRLESRDMPLTYPIDNPIKAILESVDPSMNPSINEYEQIQKALGEITRPSADTLFNNQSAFETRDLVANATPHENTPFFGDLTGSDYTDTSGHVFFYVLLDEGLYFSRDTAALITYAPEAENSLETLYTPFVQYPIYPRVTDGSKIPDGSQLDVLTFHFIRDETMSTTSVEECRYVYDEYVISKGQSPFQPRTPLFIDPAVKTRGVITE
jgi:hypothetical protein